MAGSWTPGPWTIKPPWSGFSSIHGPNGVLVFGIAAGGPDERQPPDVCEANATLIAAAPELVEALKECADDLEVEIQSRARGELPRRIERDMDTVHRARALLARIGARP